MSIRRSSIARLASELGTSELEATLDAARRLSKALKRSAREVDLRAAS